MYQEAIATISNGLRNIGLDQVLADKVFLPVERISYMELCTDGDYSTLFERLENIGEEIRVKRQKAINKIDQAQLQLSLLGPHIATLKNLEKERKQRLIEQPEWSNVRQSIIENASKEGIDPEVVDSYLKWLGNTTVKYMNSILDANIDQMWDRLNAYQIHVFASMMGAMLAKIIGESGSLQVNYEENPEEAIEYAKSVINTLWRQEEKLANAFADEDEISVKEAATKLRELLNTHKDKLFSFTSAINSIEENKRTAKHHDALIWLGDAIWSLVRAYALGSYVSSLAVGGINNPNFVRWSKKAKQLEVIQPEPVIGTLPSQLINSQIEPGQMVTVQGVVKEQVYFDWNRESGERKAIQFFKIVDDEGGEISLVVPYFNLFSLGGEVGIPIRVTGFWSDDVLSKHVPVTMKYDSGKLASFPRAGIDIDRVNLNDLAKKSWWHWVTTQLRPIFDTFPNSINAIWGWNPYFKTKILRTGLWCKQLKSGIQRKKIKNIKEEVK